MLPNTSIQRGRAASRRGLQAQVLRPAADFKRYVVLASAQRLRQN